MKRKHKKYLALAIIIGMGVFWLYLLYDVFAMPDTAKLRYTNPTTSSFIELYEKKHPEAKIKQVWVPYEKISPNLKEAVIASEDDQFFEHKGFNIEAIKKAAIYDWKKKKFARGASTITQQLARNLYLTPSKNPIRKLREFVIALELESQLSKQRILEIYLNIVEWGPGVYGCEAAARHYFNKSAASLSSSEAAYLASILPSPRRLGKKGVSMTPRAERIKDRID